MGGEWLQARAFVLGVKGDGEGAGGLEGRLRVFVQGEGFDGGGGGG